jgi:hypothetical protein
VVVSDVRDGKEVISEDLADVLFGRFIALVSLVLFDKRRIELLMPVVNRTALNVGNATCRNVKDLPFLISSVSHRYCLLSPPEGTPWRCPLPRLVQFGRGVVALLNLLVYPIALI